MSTRTQYRIIFAAVVIAFAFIGAAAMFFAAMSANELCTYILDYSTGWSVFFAVCIIGMSEVLVAIALAWVIERLDDCSKLQDAIYLGRKAWGIE